MSLLEGKSRAPKSKKDKPESTERKVTEIKTITNILSLQIKKERLFTDENIDELLKLTFSNGVPFLSMSKKDILFEFIGGYEKFQREKEGNFDYFILLTEAILSVAIPATYSIIDGAPWFKTEKIYYEKEIRRLKIQITAKKGIFKCPQCLASKEKRDPTNTETVEIQIRSGDEPTTNFNNCNTCGYRWKV